MMSILMMLVSSVAFAQNNTVSGNVTDNSGEPIIGATIKVKGGAATQGTITDIDGNFSLMVAPGSTLIISYLGCETKEVKASDNMKVVLQDNAKELSEVVVTGYTTQRKADLTGSVAVVSTKT